MRWAWVASLCIVAPLLAVQTARGSYATYRFVYLHGPAIMGGWEGQAIEEVCSKLTQTSSQLWQRGSTRAECIGIIDRKVTSHLVGSLTVVAIAMAYHVSKYAAHVLIWSACTRMEPRSLPASNL